MRRHAQLFAKAFAIIVAFCWLVPIPMFGQADNNDQAVKQAYQAYVNAWKSKDIPALERVISDDYMAVNSEGKVSDKKNEIATAKADPEWTSMSVDEIHTREFGNSAVATGFISAQGKRSDGSTFAARVRFLAMLVKQHGVWQLIATQSGAIKPAPQT